MDTRWNDILTIWKQWRGSYELTFGVMLVLLGIWIGSLFFAADAGYGTNLYTEALGVLVTIAVLNTFARQREQAQLKNRLVREAASRDNSTAVSAVDWMRHEDWLTGDDGLLKEADLSNANLENADFGREANLPGANLWRANLPGADLFQANLPGAKLSFVNLTGADLRGANLTRADLTFANLTGADLTFANLTGADLKDANLTDADLTFANLTGADLKDANLTGANLWQANLTDADLTFANLTGADLRAVTFDEKTVLPDAQLVGHDANGKKIYDKYWTPDTDMTRYTDPNHPDYWQP